MAGTVESADDRFGAVVAALAGEGGVTHGGVMFSATNVLKVNNKVFLMLVGERLVVKLPKTRVDALVGSGDGVPFDPSHGRPMKEWLSLDPASKQDWLTLSREALAFVAKKS